MLFTYMPDYLSYTFPQLGMTMHRAPTPTPDDDPLKEDEPAPFPEGPSPEEDPVPDHNPS